MIGRLAVEMLKLPTSREWSFFPGGNCVFIDVDSKNEIC